MQQTLGTRRTRWKGLPWSLFFALIFVSFIGYLVYGYYSARAEGRERADALYFALQDSDDAAVKPKVTGYALDKLVELEEKYGPVLEFEIVKVNAKPADLWSVQLRVVRERGQTT